MMEETRHPSAGKKRRGKRRGLVWIAVLVALALGLGFVVTQGGIDLSETLSTVREISRDAGEELKDAGEDLKSTVDSAVRRDGSGDGDAGDGDADGHSELAARLSKLEDRVSVLEARSAEPPLEGGDEEARLASRIEFELFATEAFDLDSIDVAVAGGTVTLSGTVRAEAEKVLAERIAQEVPGVTAVENELRIEAQRLRPTGG
jgi:hypothetical protein